MRWYEHCHDAVQETDVMAKDAGLLSSFVVVGAPPGAPAVLAASEVDVGASS